MRVHPFAGRWSHADGGSSRTLQSRCRKILVECVPGRALLNITLVWRKIQLAISKLDRAAWLRFFGALFGLAFAFVAAIYSTVFRESGNLIGTAIAASLALLMAALVGITTVPYLAKRVAF